MPLHNLMVFFDRGPQSPGQVDLLLTSGYNPNQYDSTGLSPYHLCVIHRQKKGLQYLLDISSKNPGFFDLEMPSLKEGRNILHYSVFLKNYSFTKALIEAGFPPEMHDASGTRLIHLVDQNYEFLTLLRKLLKNRAKILAQTSTNAVLCSKKPSNYVKHPQRLK
jgi:ankyrin repeat protein